MTTANEPSVHLSTRKKLRALFGDRIPRLVFGTTAPVVLCLTLIEFSTVTHAQGSRARQALEAQFREWLSQTVWPDARSQGIARETFDRAFASVALDWTLPDLQPPGSTQPAEPQHQAEFQSPGRYFPEGQLASLSREGRTQLERWRTQLDTIEQHYGVPREIVVAIWGREYGFGRVAPDRSAIRVLATQAFMGRRKSIYFPELLAALKILQEERVPPDALVSTWAGAMGQPQFLPSKFLRYAVDGDKDGVRDIWHSVPDTLASIAHYLREHGWQSGHGWGVEVAVPNQISCALEGPRQGRPAQAWQRLGVDIIEASMFGDSPTYLLMPAGRLGPSFLVADNFYVLKQYNESDLYALFVGHLADRMRRDASFKGQWAATGSISRSVIVELQKRLQADGHDVGRVDGLLGFATRTAIGQWQAKHGLAETCFPDPTLLQRVRAR
jgi:lytic murein transglycosylase